MTSPSTPAFDAHEMQRQRPALLGHCYRMLGSVVDADDAVQETLLRAWKAQESFEARSSLKTWLYRIATNVCLDALSRRERRLRPQELRPAGFDPALTQRSREHWVEPVADAAVMPDGIDPAEAAMLRQSIRLAFVAALQHLPPRQRAAYLLSQVLGFRAREIAESLGTSEAGVNSALQRARENLEGSGVDPSLAPEQALTEEQRALVDRYERAFTAFDVDALVSLLHEDATMSMPPFEMWLESAAAIGAFLRGPGAECRGSRLVRMEISGMPAFAQYRHQGREPWGLIVLGLRGDRVATWNSFLDVETLFPRFGLPASL